MPTRALWRFDETKDEDRSIDAIGAVRDLDFAPVEFSTAQALARALGWGRWTAGYHFNELAGNAIPSFGATQLTPVSSPVYGVQGYRSSARAIGLDSNADNFLGTGVYGFTATEDFGLLAACRFTSKPTSGVIFRKGVPADASYWCIYTDGNGNIVIEIKTASGIKSTFCSHPSGEWFGLGVPFDRATNRLRIATLGISSNIAAASPEIAGFAEAVSTATDFAIGSGAGFGPTPLTFQCDSLYLGIGVGNMSGASANLPAMLANFRSALVAQPAIVDAAAGRGRSFVALSRHALEAADIGSTALTRNASVQALVRWDLQEQGAAMQWSLTKVGGVDSAWDAGASSVQTIAGDGRVSATVPTANRYEVFGFSEADPDQNYASVKYGWYTRSDGLSTIIIEFGAMKFDLGVQAAAGDVLEVERIGSTLRYYRNGSLVYTSLVASSAPLLIDTAFYLLAFASSLTNFTLTDAGVRKSITWQKIVGVLAQPTTNTAGTLYVRGKSSPSSEYINAGVELRVVNASLGIGELRWLWQDSGGGLRRQTGGQFTAPTDGEILLTATRRWESPTKVVMRYYANATLLAEVESFDGDIAGSTAATTTIGGRFDGSKWLDFFDGVIDEMRVVDYELTAEEVEATWLRLAQHQPDGYRRMVDLMPPGIPISDDPTSKAQTDLRSMGEALGYASAQIENFRANIMPDRAYGVVLERWESITKQFPKVLDSIERRRRRVVAHLAKRAGVAIKGVRAALEELLATKATNIDVIAFDPTLAEDWLALRRERWLDNASAAYGASATIQKTAGPFAYDTGAAASTFFTGDCWVEFAVDGVSASRYIALTSETTFSFDPTTFDYAIRYDVTDYSASENGVQQFFTGLVAGDVLRIERVGTQVRYRRNGTIYYTSPNPSTAPLRLSIAFASNGGYVAGLRMGTGRCDQVPIVWVEKTGSLGITDNQVENYGGRIVKTAAGGSWDAGASSVETIAGDGYVEFSPMQTNANRMIGFSLTDANVNYTSIGWGFFPNGGAALQVFEDGVNVFSGGAYAIGDVLRVERVGPTVYYKKNGATVYTSTKLSSGPLLVDSSFSDQGGFENVRLYDAGSRKSITWQNVVGCRTIGDSLRIQAAAGTYLWNVDNPVGGVRAVMTVDAARAQLIGRPDDFNGCHMFVAMEPALLPANAEAGIVLWDYVESHFLFFGLRNAAGAYQVGYQRLRTDGGASDAAWQVLAVTSQTKHWLRLRPGSGAFGGTAVEQLYDLSWSTTGSAEAQLTTQANLLWRRTPGWWGCYVRTFGAAGTQIDVRFAESLFRNTKGSRPFYFYAARDRQLAGDPDFEAARSVVRRMRHAYTHASVIAQRSFLADDPYSVTDGGPVGGI